MNLKIIKKGMQLFYKQGFPRTTIYNRLDPRVHSDSVGLKNDVVALLDLINEIGSTMDKNLREEIKKYNLY